MEELVLFQEAEGSWAVAHQQMATRQLSLLPLKSGVNIGDLQVEAVHWCSPIPFWRMGLDFLCVVSTPAGTLKTLE